MNLTQIKGPLLLLLASAVWGLAMAFQSSAADAISPFTFNASRSLLAAVFLLVLLLIRYISAKQIYEKNWGKLILGGSLSGLFLCVSINLQQYGLSLYPAGSAASGRAGFLTATYVIMVAVFSMLRNKHFRLTIFFAVTGCIAGMYLLCRGGTGIGLQSTFRSGDLAMLGCAVSFSVYILLVEFFASGDALFLSFLQFLVCGLLSLCGAFLWEKPSFQMLQNAWLPIVYVGIFSSGIGYTLQMFGQKYTDAAVASIIMSLESVFAALGGWLMLQEHLSPTEFFGCALVFLSVLLAQWPGRRR